MKEFSAKKIAALAVMAALLVLGKFVLNMIPNVEVVSLFCALFGYVFGFISVIPVTVFCLIEIAYWGINTWVIAYLIHFNSIVIVFWLLSKRNLGKPYIVAPIIAVLTFLFGVLEAGITIGISGFTNYFSRFTIYYMRGIVFVITHIISNVVIFALLFTLLAKLLSSIKDNLKI